MAAVAPVVDRALARLPRQLPPLTAWTASGLYLAVALAWTWPLAAHLADRLPLDLGDPLLNSWILQWDADRFLRLLRADWQALSGFWNAGIFHPEPLALAYSEHLIPQALQALPIYAATGNIILAYNVLFLSTFALSGLGVFLLVRELTDHPLAAFAAGLCYAFTPYRLSQLGHLQVLSSQWMPFVLFGLCRFFRARSLDRFGRSWQGSRALAGAIIALVAQNLSCGYYLLYFSPFVAAFALWEVNRRRLWRDLRGWILLAGGAAVTAVATLPFLVPYLELRGRGFARRPLAEVMGYSADALTYFRATDSLWLWPNGFADPLSTEAVLFQGITPMVLAAVALAGLAVALQRRASVEAPLQGWRLAAAVPVVFAGIAALGLTRFELFAGRRIWRVREAWPALADITHVFALVTLAVAALILLSPRARAAARLAAASRRVFFTAALLAAVWLSFGPQATTRQHGISGPTVYAFLYHHVPGFDGLRVPARFGMLAALFLSVLAGCGAALVEGAHATPDGQASAASPPWRRTRCALVVAASAFFLVESTGAPIDVAALEWARRDGRPGTVSAADLGRVYEFIRKLPAGTVVAEFPFGGLLDETRAVFLSTLHRHPIVNGYSGGFPASYEAKKAVLQDPLGAGDAAWQALIDSRATCLVVHEWAFEGGNGRAMSRWLEDHGALPAAAFRSDRIFEVRR